MDTENEHKGTVTREFEWNIEKFDAFLVSEIFEVFLDNNSTKWQIVLHRDGDKVYALLKMMENSRDDFIVDLTINSLKYKDQAVNVQYDAKYFNETWLYVHTIDNITYLEARQEVKISIDSFTLQIKISLTPKAQENANQCGLTCMMKNYSRFLNSEQLSDLKLICSDGVQFPAHKFVLIANAPEMFKMLSVTDKKHERKITNVNGETMQLILEFLYTGQIQDVLKLESKLLNCADKFNLDGLKSHVVELMIKNISVNNVLEYIENAYYHDEDELMEKCLLFVHKNYRTLQESEEWDDFDPKVKALLKLSFVRDGYKNPVYVLKTLMNYLSYNLPDEYKRYP